MLIRISKYIDFPLNSFTTIRTKLANDQHSPFYIACREGDEEAVKKYLPSMRIRDIRHHEHNGDTPLHVAAHNGHENIVKLLLDYGCKRSPRDSLGRTPSEVAKTPSIKNLFMRRLPEQRFDAEMIRAEWTSDNFDGIWKNMLNPIRLFELTDVSEEDRAARQNCVLNWVEKVIEEEKERRAVLILLQESFEKDDAEPILEAYTMDTSFYKQLNKALAEVPVNNEDIQLDMHPALIIARTLFRSAYYGRHTANFSGLLYRAVTYNSEDIKNYEDHVDKGPFKTKSFWSTSKYRECAEKAVKNNYNAMLIMNSRDKRSRRTLELKELSDFPEEDEVLIVPLTYMQVKSVKKGIDDKYEINLIYWDW